MPLDTNTDEDDNEVWGLEEFKNRMAQCDDAIDKALSKGGKGGNLDGLFSFRYFEETLYHFGKVFGPKMLNEHKWLSEIKGEVAKGDKSVFRLTGNGAITATWFTVQNHIDNHIDDRKNSNGHKKKRPKGGRWTTVGGIKKKVKDNVHSPKNKAGELNIPFPFVVRLIHDNVYHKQEKTKFTPVG